jgi:membrane-associated phospholipid phosphatase
MRVDRIRLPLLSFALCLPLLASAAESQGPPTTTGSATTAACPQPPPPTGPTYFLASEADTVTLLPPPPPADSDLQQRDLQAVLDAQRQAHATGATARAVADAEISCGRFADVLGEQLKSKEASKALAFVTRAAVEGAGATRPVKRYWKRPRPYVVSSKVERLADMAPDAKDQEAAFQGALQRPTPGRASAGGANAPDAQTGAAAPSPDCVPEPRPSPPVTESEEKKKADRDKAEKERAYASYPSGHSAFGTICALVLADIVPEKRYELFARGREYGAARLVVGAHFPDDVESGRIAGTLATALMRQNARFQHDLAEARVSLRAALGLAAEPPDLTPHPKGSADASATP